MTTSAIKKKYITLDIVSDTTTNLTDIAGAREHLKHLIGRKVIVRGATVLKRIKRHEHLRLYVQPADSTLSVFAEFTRAKDAASVAERKIRKSSRIALIGELISFGFQSACLNNCRLIDVGSIE